MKRAITFSFGLVLIWFCSLLVTSSALGTSHSSHQIRNAEHVRAVSVVLFAEEDADSFFKLKNSFNAVEYITQSAPTLLISGVTTAFKVVHNSNALHLFSSYHQFF